jgi:hypothetical protein
MVGLYDEVLLMEIITQQQYLEMFQLGIMLFVQLTLTQATSSNRIKIM